jgi:hypothetical protein
LHQLSKEIVGILLCGGWVDKLLERLIEITGFGSIGTLSVLG